MAVTSGAPVIVSAVLLARGLRSKSPRCRSGTIVIHHIETNRGSTIVSPRR